jgi:A/G-specific adenine glycosylase
MFLMLWPGSAALLAPLAPWFDEARRVLPWRALDLHAPHPDPYAVLVSELMLQQTQVATVIPFFQRWMERFPDASTLAAASEDEIHKLWEGLGYYRRARLLQGAAQGVVKDGWPKDLENLLELPGLGPYTAAAMASIAFQLPEAALDGNAFRVLARLLGIEENPRKSAARLREWLKPGLRTHGPSLLTQAIMELGATVCTPSPRCAKCPLASDCEARRQDATDRIPARPQRPVPREVSLWLLAVQSKGRWLLHPPAAHGLLAGLWRWPALAFETTLEGAAEEPHPFGLAEARTWPGWIQEYSHRREHIHPLALQFEAPFPAPKDLIWLDASELEAIPMGRRDQRLQELLRTPPAVCDEAPPLAGLLRLLQSRP